MQILSVVTLLLCSAVSHAAPLVGYSTMEPANLYQIKNTKAQIIYSATADTVKRVELRDGFGVIQTMSNNVSLITEDKATLVDSAFGSEFLISKKLLAVYTPNGIGSVYNVNGTKVFPAITESQTRPVKQIWIANDHFAVIDRMTSVLNVYDASGSEIFASNDIELVLLSDGYLMIKSLAGTLSVYDMALMSEEETGLITTDTRTSMEQVSDQFAGFIDSFGNLRLFSHQEGEFPPMLNVTAFTLNNTFAMVTDNFGLTLYGTDQSTLESPTVRKNYSTSHELFAYTTVTGALFVKNEARDESFMVNRADTYAMSDDLLIVKNGMGDFTVYSLSADHFGKVVHSILDQTIAQYQVGNGIVSFQTTLQSGASNNVKALSFTSNTVGTLQKSVLVDESPVNKVNLSMNREELNWK